VRGLKKSEPPAALDDVYLVAYSQHRGQYREDALDGLQVVSERVLARDMASGRFAAFISSILGFFFFLFGLVIDSDIESFPQDVRLEDVQNAKGLLFGFGGLWWGTGEATRLFGANPFEMAPLSVLGLYAGLALCALLLVRWLYRSSPDPFDPSDFRQG
jgi:hypothetical protein